MVLLTCVKVSPASPLRSSECSSLSFQHGDDVATPAVPVQPVLMHTHEHTHEHTHTWGPSLISVGCSIILSEVLKLAAQSGDQSWRSSLEVATLTGSILGTG